MQDEHRRGDHVDRQGDGTEKAHRLGFRLPQHQHPVIGGGLISFLGLLASGWSLAWRARSALVQGLFLAVLGVGVLAATAYRVLVLNQPEAELMGLFGAVALAVNMAAAAVLLPHRTGDANVRAVWLFSRNDAVGNLAVVVAAGLV